MDSQYFRLHIHCTAILTWACHIPTTGHTGVLCALQDTRPRHVQHLQTASGARATRRMPKATRPPHAGGPGDHRSPAGRAPATRTARAARETVRPSKQPKCRAASKSKRGRAADAAAARCQRHLPVGICKQTVRSFGRASKVQVAWKVSLTAGRQAGWCAGAAGAAGSPSRLLELLVA